MQDPRGFGPNNQIPPHWKHRPQGRPFASLLGNTRVQVPSRGAVEILESVLPTTTPLSKLEELKKQQFTDEDKDERIARSLAALNQQSPIHLSPEEWKFIVEDSDIEDQF